MKYYNPHLDNNYRSLKDVILWQMGYYNDAVPPPNMPEGFEYPNPREVVDASRPSVRWINHCTFSIMWNGMHILTDPVWSERVSPVKFAGPKRRHDPGLSMDELDPVDIVLLSHNHYDHLDEPTVRELNRRWPQIIWVVPKGVAKWFKKRGFANVHEMGWWDQIDLPKFRVTSVPTQHFSGRTLFDKDKTWWCGYVLEDGSKRLYFVGDTGYNPFDFKAIGETFGHMDLSLIPMGTYVPHKFMDPVHICPVKATSIHGEVNSKLSVGMHWKTFRLSGEGQMQPPYDLYLALEEAGHDPLSFRVLDPGQSINW